MLCLLPAAPVFAATNYIPKVVDPMSEPWRWQHIKKLDGLGVLNITQALDGALWFGLAHGVVRYDGLQWHHFSKTTTGTNISHVTALLQASDGTIYGRSAQGILQYKDNAWHILLQKSRGSVNSKLIESSDGSVWSIELIGLIQIKSGRIIEHALRDIELDDIMIDADENLWAVERSSGIVHKYPMLNGLIQHHLHQTTKPPKNVIAKKTRHRIALRQGCLWLSDWEYINELLCYKLKTKQWINVNLQNLGGSNRIFGLGTDTNGALWVWGAYAISVYKNGEWTVYRAPEFSIPDEVYSLIHAKDGSVWLGGQYTNVLHINLNQQRWGESYAEIHFQGETSTGTRWFLDVSGKVVAHYPDSDQWIAFSSSETGIKEPSVVSVSRDDTIWVAGTHNDTAAVAHYDGNTWHRDLHPNLSRTISHLSGIETTAGEVLFGALTFGALAKGKSQKGGIVAYSKIGDQYGFKWLAPPQAPIRVVTMVESQDQTLWSAQENIVYLHKDNRVELLVTETTTKQHPELIKLRRGRVKHIVTSDDGRIWIAHARTGIYNFDGAIWQRYTTDYGLPSNLTTHVLPLVDDTTLAITTRGLSRFDGVVWSNFLTEATSVFPETHTLKLARDGGIWVNFAKQDWYLGSSKTLEVKRQSFKSLYYRFDDHAPDTRIEIYSNEIPHNGFNHVFWSGTDAWSHDDGKLLQYSYRLDDDSWSNFSASQRHTFGDMEPGQHTLEVRARDSDFNIDLTPARVSFYVVPPLWRQTWFQITTLAVIAVVLFFMVVIIRIREAYIRAVEELKLNFFTNISHELRTPLTLILGPLEQVLSEKQYNETAISMAQRSAQRLLTLVNQLLDFRKAQTTGLQLRESEADFVGHVREIAESMQPLATKKNISYQIELPAHVCSALFDTDKLEKILTNLIANAIKYTPKHGTVYVQLSILDETLQANQQAIAKFIIEDSGIGIAKEQIEQIFKPFYRVDNSSSTVEGSGIGMALTKELVDLCHGSIEIESPIYTGSQNSERKGTRVIFTLPIDKLDVQHVNTSTSALEEQSGLAAPTQIGQEEDDDTRGTRLLIVEDDLDVQRFLTSQMQKNYNVVTADNGEEGLMKAHEVMPDLIITDVMMPVIDGIEMCDRLKTNEATSHIPIIMLTARTSLEAELEGLETGADDYITKPFAIPILEARIHNLLESRCQLRERFGTSLKSQPKTVTTNATDEKFLRRAIEAIENNLSNHEYSIDDFANDMNMKYKTLYVKIKALSGQSLQAFIRTIRLEHSVKLLKENELSIREIAMKVGFDNPSYFSSCFKQQFGFLPSEIDKLD